MSDKRARWSSPEVPERRGLSPAALSTARLAYGSGGGVRLRRLPGGCGTVRTVRQLRIRDDAWRGGRQGSSRGVKALVDELIHSSAAAEGGGRCTGQPLCCRRRAADQRDPGDPFMMDGGVD